MSQFLLSVWHDDEPASVEPETMAKMYSQVDEFNRELTAASALVFGGGLEPSSTACVINAGADSRTAGPYSTSIEQLGGFWVIEATDIDAAMDVARRASAACMGPVEVRRFQDEPTD